MAGFDGVWAAVNRAKDGEAVSSELRPLLQQVYSDVLAVPADLPALKDSLTRLLEYLNGAGKTNANSWAVDLFFCVSEGWERDWAEENLPDDFHDVRSLMGQALQDTVQRPKLPRTSIAFLSSCLSAFDGYMPPLRSESGIEMLCQ